MGSGSALASHSDKLKCKLLTQFSAFFSRFISSCIHSTDSTTNQQNYLAVCVVSGGGGGGGGGEQKVSESVGKCFVGGCHLLCLLAQIPLSQSFPTETKGWL